MARTAIPLSSLVANGNLVDPAGTSADATNNHTISGAPLEEIVVRVVNGSSGDNDVTIKGVTNGFGTTPDTVVTMGTGTTRFFGPFESASHEQPDSALYLDIEVATSTKITAFHVPRT